MNTHQSIVFCYSLIALLLVWITVFTAWRAYRASALREELETLRERLFALTTSSRASPASPAVRYLNTLLDAAMRQPAMMTFARLLLADTALRWRLLTLLPTPDWGECSDLHTIYDQMGIVIARHVVSGCPLLWFLPAAISAAFRPTTFAEQWSIGARLIPDFVALDTLLLQPSTTNKGSEYQSIGPSKAR